MKKNIVILGILLSTLYLVTVARVSAYGREDINVTLWFDNVTTLSYPITGDAVSTIALYTESQSYPTKFSFSTSMGSTPYYNTIVGGTSNITQLSPIQNDIVQLHLVSADWHFNNNYKGIFFY